MLSTRNQRRLAAKQAKKNGSSSNNDMGLPIPMSLGQAMGQVQALAQQLPELLRLIDELKRVGPVHHIARNLDQARFAIATLIEDFGSVDFELRKQRAVNLRLLALTSFTNTGLPELKSVEGVQGLLDLETQFRAEFDALQFFAALPVLLHHQEDQ